MVDFTEIFYNPTNGNFKSIPGDPGFPESEKTHPRKQKPNSKSKVDRASTSAQRDFGRDKDR